MDSFNNAGTSSAGGSDSGTTAVLAPSGLQAVALSPTAIQIIWRDNSSDETGFYVYRLQGDGSWENIATVGAGVTTYTDTDSTVSPTTDWQYKVTAYKTIPEGAAEESPASNLAHATIGVDSPPAAPINLHMSSDGTMLFFDPGDDSNDADFMLERSRNGSNFAQTGAILQGPDLYHTNYSFVCPGTLYGETYTYKVIARGAGGESSAMVTYTAPAAAPPQVFVGASEYSPDYATWTVHVDWSATLFNAGNQATGFKGFVYKLDADGNVIDPSHPDMVFSGTPDGSSPYGKDAWATVDFTTLAAGQYKVHIELYNAVNVDAPDVPSIYNNTGFTVSTPTLGKSAANSLIATQDGANGWDLTYGSIHDLQYSVDGANWFFGAEAADTAYMAPGAGVYLRSWAYPPDDTDNNAIVYTAPVYIYGPALAAPTGLSAVASNDSGTPVVTLRWNEPADLRLTNVDIVTQTIEIERSGDSGATYQLVGSCNFDHTLPDGTFGCYDSPPGDGASYLYRLRQSASTEWYTTGYSSYSGISAITPPNPPTNVGGYAQTPTELIVMWTDPSDSEAQTNVEVATDAAFTHLIATGTAGFDARSCLCTPIGDNVMAQNGAYYIRAENVGASGLHSGWSVTGGAAVKYPTITKLIDASETAPDGTSGDGYFEVDRPSYTPAYGQPPVPMPAVTVNYTIDTSAPNAAVPGKDYQPLSGTVSFAAGATSAIVAVVPKLGEFVAGVTGVTAVVQAGSGTTPSSPPPPSATVTITSANIGALIIDSNNVAGLRDPALTYNAAEAAIKNDPTLPGKLIVADVADSTGSGVPDFANGIDEFGNDAGSAAPFVPIAVELPRGIDPTALSFSLLYSASDPADVQRTGAGTDADPYVYAAATGAMRIWTKDGTSSRNVADLNGGGDYLAPDITYAFSSLPPSTAMGNNVWMFYVEAVCPSQTLADDEISITVTPTASPFSAPVTDSVRATAFNSEYAQIAPDGSMQPTDQPEVSNPSPVIDLSSYSIDNLHLSSDGMQILGDIHVVGTITDAASNLIDGADGTIGSANLYLNGSLSPTGTVSVTTTKTANPNSILSPYAYSGSFDGVISNVAVQPGWNAVRLTAANFYGFAGFAEANMEVVVGDPSPFTVKLLVDPYGNSGIQQLPVTFTYADGTQDGFLLKRITGTTQFGDAASGGVSIDIGSDPASRSYTVTNVDHGANGELVIFSPITGGQAQGTVTPDPENQTTYKGSALTQGDKSLGDFSSGGTFSPFALKIDGPTEIQSFLSSATIGTNAYTPVLYQGSLYLASTANPAAPRALIIAESPKVPPSPESTYVPLGPTEDGIDEYTAGFIQGMVDTGAGLWDGVKMVAKTASKIGPLTNPGTLAVAISYHYATPGAFTADVKAVKLAWTKIQPVAAMMQSITAQMYTAPVDLIKAFITGDCATLNAMGAQFQRAGEVVGEVLEQCATIVNNLTSYQYGRITGRILGETLLLVGPGAAASALTKGELLLQLAAKIQDIEWMPEAIKNMFAEGGVIKNLINGLTHTNMCFAPGTLVHTADGLQKIEEIRRGDLVLSRDESTGTQAYKAVINTFVTHPTRLYHINYRTDSGRCDKLICTAPHPFHVRGRGFVSADQLTPGNEFSLAEGMAAEILSVTTEQAVDGHAFATYNFEVEDFHTYFVGQAGVWVHNAGDALCDRVFSLYNRIVERGGLQDQPWEAFKILMQKTANMKGIDAALPKTIDEVMTQVYAKAIGPDGVADWRKVPTVKQMRAVMAGRGEVALIDTQHTAMQFWTKELVPGITQSELDDMPGLLLRRVDHRIGNEGSYHTILQKILPLNSTTNKDIILAKLELAYTKWDSEEGPMIWKIVKAWLATKGVS